MPFLTRILKGELRATIALSAVLLALVGWSLAANSDATVSFDFGDGQGVAPGYISVSSSMYPTSISGLEMGWLQPVIIKSHGGAVADLRLRDSNVGIDPATFKISGLTRSLYNAEIISGDFVGNTATKVTYAGQDYLIRSDPNQWNRVIISVVPIDGVVEIDFSRLGTAETLWAVNAIVLTATDTALSKPVFDVTIQPTSHTVYAGGQAVYRVNISSPNSYASNINIAITDLSPSMTAQITPSQGLAPFSADLRLVTTVATSATIYSFTVQVQGDDADKLTISKKISLTVTGSQNITSDPNSTGTQIDYLNLLPATMREMLSSQERIELLEKLQEQRLANVSQLQDLNDLNFSGAAPILEEMPEAEGSLGAALMYLTKAGIIGSVVDYAPPADEQEQPTGFWGKFFGSVSNPVR
jgi:hypothetical protein